MDTASIIDITFKGLIALSQLALFIYVRSSNRNDVVDGRFALMQKSTVERNQVVDDKFTQMQTEHAAQGTELRVECGALAQRLSHIESAVETAPDHSDLTKVYESINSLAATVNQLVGENRSQSDTLRLILNQITQKGMK